MRKTFLISWALVLLSVITGIASENPDITNMTLGENDTLIYLSGESLEKPMILHRGRNNISLSPYETLESSQQINGLTLDVPANDNCANAQTIGDAENMIASTVEATVDGGNFNVYPNIWYLYTSSITGRVKVAVEDTFRTARNGRIAVYDGFVCPDHIELPQPVMLQGGENIETATQITDPLPLVITGSIGGNVRDYTECSCTFEHGYVGPDVVYSYTAPANDSINIILVSDNSDTHLIILDADGNELACKRRNTYEDLTGSEGTAVINLPVTEGETYYIVVSCFNMEACNDYTLLLYPPDNTMICSSYPSFRYYTDITFDAVEGHQYLIEISYEVPSSTSTLSVGPAPEPPENDICANATDGGNIEVGVTVQYTGDNTGATETDHSINNFPEIWIKFTLQDTMDIKLDYCGNTSITDYLSWNTAITRDCSYSPGNWYSGEYVLVHSCPNASPINYWHDLPPGTYYYAMVIHHDYEGYYAINVTGLDNGQCESDALFGQVPTNLLETGYSFHLSDFESGYAMADKFSNVGGVINQIAWWGVNVDPGTGINCDPSDPYQFQVIICDFDQTSPYLPGDTVGIYDVTAIPQPTGYIIHEYLENELPQYKFIAALPETLTLENGWLMIRGNDGFNQCSFAWQNSEVGSYGVAYDDVENAWTRLHGGLAFCLGETQVGIDEAEANLPLSFDLLQNYPNPFNATTSIQFSLESNQNVCLTIYDIGGRLIKTLYDGELSAGVHNLIWDGTNLSGEVVSSGIYFYTLKSAEQTLSNSMVLLK